MARKLKYRNFVDRIDIDRFEEAINFDIVSQTDTEDTGYCFDLYGLHSHGDTTGKFSINREKRVYNCWVCGGGSLLDLVIELFGMDGDAAKDWLYQFVDGEENPEQETNRLRDMLYRNEEDKPSTLPYFNEHALDRFEHEHPWFGERGIHPDVAETYKLRYSPTHKKHAPKNKDEDPYVGPAIILPHYWGSKLVGWQARFLESDRPKWCGKYVNTTDFPKEETLFNYDRTIDSDIPPIVVESVPTTLWLESCGYPSLCTFGASVTDKQMKLLRRFSSGVILAFDNDRAGFKAQDQLTEYLCQFIPVYHLPVAGKKEGADLGDLAPNDKLVDLLVECASEPLGASLRR